MIYVIWYRYYERKDLKKEEITKPSKEQFKNESRLVYEMKSCVNKRL